MDLKQYLEGIYGYPLEWDEGKRTVYKLLNGGGRQLIGWYDPRMGDAKFCVRPDELVPAFDDVDMEPTFHWRYVIRQDRNGHMWISVKLTTAGELVRGELLENIRNGEVYGDTAE